MPIPVIDPNRIQRPSDQGRRIEWPTSLRTRMKFRALLGELVDCESLPPDPEVLDRMEALRDEIRSLPGFPRSYNVEEDVIVPTTTSSQR